ncbi:DDE-type integrase/transposase/recombinase [Methylobacterium nodulans]|uniref:DDE-type integrase/transposase/recombinase n=1 Tax=Methylobacterium nodulans TaxID=114616 RepID=UPI0001618F2B
MAEGRSRAGGFTLSCRDVEELLAERGISVAYESVRCWVMTFAPAFARNLRRLRPRPASTWHLGDGGLGPGPALSLWRAVDAEGEVLDLLVQSKRGKKAALKLLRKLIKKQASPQRSW